MADNRPTEPINQVDFSKPHNPDDYLHYSFSILRDGKKHTFYESIEKSTRDVVYRGTMSYHERKDPEGYRIRKFKSRSNYKESLNRFNSSINEDDFVHITPDELLEKKMREMLTKEE